MAEELELDLVDGHHGGDQLLDVFLRTTFEKIFNPPSLLSDKYLFLRFLVLTFSPQSVEQIPESCVALHPGTNLIGMMMRARMMMTMMKTMMAMTMMMR